MHNFLEKFLNGLFLQLLLFENSYYKSLDEKRERDVMEG